MLMVDSEEKEAEDVHEGSLNCCDYDRERQREEERHLNED